MKSEQPTEKSIFLEALDIESPRDRAAFIEAECQGDPQLLASVSALFHEHERTSNPIDKPIARGVRFRRGKMDDTRSLSSQPGHLPQALGTMIGPYKLMEKIGEGGFGIVYVADQQDPFAVAIRGQLVSELPPSTAAKLAERVEGMLTASRKGGVVQPRVDDAGDASIPNKRPQPFAKRQNRMFDMLYGANLYVAGWAHLRAGDYGKAIARLAESNEAPWLGRGIAYPLMAIAGHKMGDADSALRSFAQSQALLDRMLDDSVSRSKGCPSIPWIDWIEFLLNHREASILVKGQTPAIDPRLRQMESFAEAAIAN